MGRTIEFYIVKKDIQHDKSRPLCFDFEFEPDEYDLKEILYEYEYGKIENWITKPKEELQLIRQRKQDVILKYLHSGSDEERNKQWCPKCKIFTQGFYKSEYVIDMYTSSHSYSNSIWQSKFNVHDMYIGSFNTDFVNLFKIEHCYRETCQADIERTIRYLEQFGQPVRESDKEAYDETINILNFLKSYSKRDDVRLIISDEL